jgi:uncharacterized protein involved in type VI secretion and phage assembly
VSFLDLIVDTAERVAHNERIYGVVVGIVRDIKDPDGLGRVKVDFPWLGEESEAVAIESDEDRAHSNWARVATLMAGPERGTFFIPEVDDEVLVAFEHGDPSRPFVIGVLWNSDDKPPETMDGDGKNDIRSIHSRSGHKIILDDSDDNTSITIVDKDEKNKIFLDTANEAMEITITGNLTIDVGGDITIKAGGKIEATADGDIKAESQGNLEMKAGGSGKLEATGALDLKSSASLTAEGSGTAELKGASVTVNGSGMAEVKGGLVKIN